MAIVHVAFKSSSQAPPAAAHAQYIARDGRYARRGGVELVESGNMPEFAQVDPFAFWTAADAHERANGRAYTEIQIALPRELGRAEREELAREATRELMGDRFAYTMAVHVPLAKDNTDQPHMHLMFSERAVDEITRGLAEERFFKRNGAKKDPAWNDRTKPDQVREQWVEMMNRAMERAGQEQRLDARSWAKQGREDLAALVEPKLLGGDGREAAELREEVDELRRKREELPPLHLSQESAAEKIEKRAVAEIVQIEKERDEQLGILDKLIERARAFMAELRAKKTAAARENAERERRTAEAAAEAKREAEHRQKQEQQINERAEELWQRSPGGLAEQAARKRQAGDKVREAAFEENVRSAEGDLAAWKKQSWVRSLLYENHDLQADVARAVDNLAAHRKAADAFPERLAAFAAQKEAAWPALQRQAAEDVREIAVRLQPEQARLLVYHVFPFDRAGASGAWAQVQAGTHTLQVLDGLAEIENRGPEGFVGYLQQRHKAFLDTTLTQLAQAQGRAAARERQRDIGRSRGWKDQDRGYGE